jgi:hypothetical protein
MVDADSPSPRRRRLSSGALQRLEIAVRLADGDDPNACAELRDAVHEQATHLLKQGEPTERVVTEIKREVVDALARTGAMRGDREGARALLDKVVHWASEVRGRAD